MDEDPVNDIQVERLERKIKMLQHELRMRQWGQYAYEEEQYSPDASSLSLKEAYSRMCKIFRTVKGPSKKFPARHVLFLLRTHPTLILEAFGKRTVVSFFLESHCDLAVLLAVCQLYRQQVPWNPTVQEASSVGISDPFSEVNPLPRSMWMYSFDYEPNMVADACIYGAAPGAMKLLLHQFPHHFLMGCEDKWDLPVEILFNRVIFREAYPGKPCKGPQPGELRDSIDAMLEFHTELFLHMNDKRREAYVLEIEAAAVDGGHNHMTGGEINYLLDKLRRYHTTANSIFGEGDWTMMMQESGVNLRTVLPKMQTLASMMNTEHIGGALSLLVDDLCLADFKDYQTIQDGTSYSASPLVEAGCTPLT